MRNVLVVDDSLASARYLSMVIEGLEGYAMIGHAKSGEQAVEMFSELRPDVVFMDIILPGIDGIEATRRIVESAPEAKVIMLSSVADQPSMKENAIKTGACEMLAKPVKPDSIITALGNLFA
jgi:two-component system chemotaxis response regulator CheY